ncbi:hypothetical protein IU418_26585 [Nocardia farcinica]|uniref:hypothetical protein n=1 Tax=Nocardia farcinica TaxID=37329 RepID=UPI001B3C7EB8|nr:hypothetical protein [Nocardia farcinica]MBF6540779.1 hypothetical protein [Nocardia farcinica]
MNRADTTQVLELVAGYDCREITADLISEWHTAIGHLDRAVAEEAVHIHHKTTGFRITPEAVLDITQQIQTRTTTTPNRKRRARMGTYTITGAINYDCDRCKAPAGQPCTRDGNETAAPCITRLLGRPINEPAHNHRKTA